MGLQEYRPKKREAGEGEIEQRNASHRFREPHNKPIHARRELMVA